MRIVLSIVVVLAALCGSAMAQGIDVNPVLTTVIVPLAVTVLSGVASAVLALGYSWLKVKWGVDIEAHHRAALHSAIVSGINLAVSKVGSLGRVPEIPVSNPFKRMALDYVLKSVPDAIKKFNLTEEKIEQMILAKIPQVIGETAPVVSPPVSK